MNLVLARYPQKEEISTNMVGAPDTKFEEGSEEFSAAAVASVRSRAWRLVHSCAEK